MTAFINVQTTLEHISINTQSFQNTHLHHALTFTAEEKSLMIKYRTGVAVGIHCEGAVSPHLINR